jgi:hypothetical protein
MAKHAFVRDDSGFSIQENGDMLLACVTDYWEENGTVLTFSSDPTLVLVTIDPGMTSNQMNAAIVAAVKAKALAEFGWNMSSNTVIHRSFGRG